MKRLFPALTAAAAGVAVLSAFGTTSAEPSPEAAKIARGKYLVTIGGCNDCHTPLTMTPNGPAPDMTRMLSGHPAPLKMPEVRTTEPWGIAMASTATAFSGAFGTSFARNLTPDPETGIGKWTEKDFMATIRSGKRMGRGRALLPPMPWFNYAEATDDDLKAIYAYLRTIPPVKNQVPEPRPPPAPTAAR